MFYLQTRQIWGTQSATILVDFGPFRVRLGHETGFAAQCHGRL